MYSVIYLQEETIAEFMENGLGAEPNDELGYSKHYYKHDR